MAPSSTEPVASNVHTSPAHVELNAAVGAAFGGGAIPPPAARTTVSIVARELSVGTVAVRPPTSPAGTAAPLSTTREAMSPVPTPAMLLSSLTPAGGVNCRSADALSDHT